MHFMSTPILTGPRVPATLYVRKHLCLVPESEVACDREFATARISQKITVNNPEPGDYFIFVDGVAGAGGVVNLLVTVKPVAECKKDRSR